MRVLLLASCVAIGCAGQAPDGGDDDEMPVCPIPLSIPDAGTLTAAKAELCDVAGTMGAAHWYRLSATLPGSTTSFVQLELWDGRGAFLGGAVRTGTFTITGPDADPASCGVCVRGIGDKGGVDATEYFAIAGTVNVTAAGTDGQPLSAELSNLSFAELDPATQKTVASGCEAAVAGARIDGTVMKIGGGGGTSGGGGGGMGGGQCASGVGD
jgi:hypothetical protein